MSLRSAAPTPGQLQTLAFYNNFTDISGAPGNGTVNTNFGKCAIAAAAGSVTITSSACNASSLVFAQVLTNDTTCKSVSVQPGAGSFVITASAAATGNTTVTFEVIT
jgi:hypothetical protein